MILVPEVILFYIASKVSNSCLIWTSLHSEMVLDCTDSSLVQQDKNLFN